RYVDSMSNLTFIDLIKNNTLLSVLYSINQSQAAGILFGAKELLFVNHGGLDHVSFNYFRMYWKLAEKSQNQEVLLPNISTPANCALPLAPEPLSNYVLSNLMTGMLSEYI